MKLSATLIVRNEAAVLARCLSGIRDAVDEILVVDTGSTDDTRAIAGHHADRVLDFVWIEDFAAARQFALEAASGDWLIWLDADDVVYGAAHLRRLAAEAPADLAGYKLSYDYARDAWGNRLCSFRRERGRACPPPATPHIVNPLDLSFHWLIHYTHALWHLGRPDEALAWTQAALKIRPDDPWHRQNYFFFAARARSRRRPASHAPGAFHG